VTVFHKHYISSRCPLRVESGREGSDIRSLNPTKDVGVASYESRQRGYKLEQAS
jgi:hypothetical protein